MGVDRKVENSKIDKINIKVYKKTVLKSFLIFISFILFMSLFLPLVFKMVFHGRGSYTYNQTATLCQMGEIIDSGGGLQVLKHNYSEINDISMYKLVWSLATSRKKDWGFSITADSEKPTLNKILFDLKENYYLTTNSKELRFCNNINRLDSLIFSLNEQSPFEKLSENQEYLFNSIRFKLDSTYHNVKEDLLKIADELDYQNKLVINQIKYSQASHRNSYIAIIISIISICLAFYFRLKKV